MLKSVELAEFSNWLEQLRDTKAAARIVTRILRLQLGIIGDFTSVGGVVSELRFSFGPGYRVYFAIHEGQLIVLLAGGDKSSQSRDIIKARNLLLQWKDLINVST